MQDIVVRLNMHGTDLERVEFTMEDEVGNTNSTGSVVREWSYEYGVIFGFYNINTIVPNTTLILFLPTYLSYMQGLGRLPHCVPSIGSLLLFNSNINPYKDYQTLDNLISAGRYPYIFRC